MENVDGRIILVLLAALLLAAILAAGVARRYRGRLVALMQRGTTPDGRHSVIVPALPVVLGRAPAVSPTLADNRRAGWRLTGVLGGMSLAIGFTVAAVSSAFFYGENRLTPRRLLVLGVVYAWPLVPAVGLLWRWSPLRLLGTLVAYFAAVVLVVMEASTAAQSLPQVLAWLAMQMGLPAVVVLALAWSGRIRAAAPYLLPACIVLLGGSLLGLDALALLSDKPPAFFVALVERVGAVPTLAVFALAPWAVAVWPVIGLARWLATCYQAKAFSEFMYLVGAWWLIVLLEHAVPAIHAVGFVAFGLLAAWLWVPAGFRLARPWLTPPSHPPTLLVLRTFRRDAQMEALFDTVIERWRLSGNTLLIAGTDLASRTLNPDDLFTYLNGRLADRFIARPEEVPQRIDAFDLAPDGDGRYRVNACYCFDTTWQAALYALVDRADVVLMDLRGFRPDNAGCRYELGVLAHAQGIARVVVLFDRDTARDMAEVDACDAPPGHFVWLDAAHARYGLAERVLAALLEPP